MYLDIVVPSAYPAEVLELTLPALRGALDRAPTVQAQVVIVDERPHDRDISPLVDRLGFERLLTGGIGNGPARNRGAATGSAAWLLFMDDDVALDPGSFQDLGALVDHDALAIIGGLRPPASAPTWLYAAYEDTTINPAASAAGEAWLRPAQMAVTLLLMPRRTFEDVGGFPELPVWGWVDLMFGLRLEHRFGPGPQVFRDPNLSGVHLYEPTWTQWLERLDRAGRRLVEVQRHLGPQERDTVASLLTLDDSLRGRLKRGAGRVPLAGWKLARGRILRKLAGAAALAHGVRTAR